MTFRDKGMKWLKKLFVSRGEMRDHENDRVKGNQTQICNSRRSLEFAVWMNVYRHVQTCAYSPINPPSIVSHWPQALWSLGNYFCTAHGITVQEKGHLVTITLVGSDIKKQNMQGCAWVHPHFHCNKISFFTLLEDTPPLTEFISTLTEDQCPCL